MWADASSSPQRIDRSTAREQVARAIREAILRGDWALGNLLPSQAQLSEMFSVSVPVIREALQTLRGEGLLNIIHGKGAMVIPPDASHAFTIFKLLAERKMTTVENLIEVRSLLEPDIAALAAERATDEQIDALEAIIAPTMSPEIDIDAWVDADIRFHTRLAESTGNALLPLVIEIFTGLFAEFVKMVLEIKPTNAPVEHSAIIAALRSRDPAGARRAMLDQIASNRRDLLALERTLANRQILVGEKSPLGG